MRAVILAGGYAKRLWPITRETPKPLLPIGNRRIIDRILDKILELVSIGKVSEVIVSTNRYFEDKFRSWLNERGSESVTIFVEDTVREEHKLGSIGALKKILDEFGPDEYLVIAGDNVFSFDLKDFLSFYEAVGGSAIAVYELKNIAEATRFGVVEVGGDGRVLSFIEKPKNPPSRLVSTGCYAFTREHILLLEDYIASKENPDSPGKFIEWLHKRAKVYAFRFSGYWFDIGTPDAYIEAFIKLSRNSYISEKASLDDILIRHPIVVLDGAKIENSIVGPGVLIDRDAVLKGVRARESIILSDARIWDSKLYRSVIGSGATLLNVDLWGSVVGPFSRIKR